MVKGSIDKNLNIENNFFAREIIESKKPAKIEDTWIGLKKWTEMHSTLKHNLFDELELRANVGAIIQPEEKIEAIAKRMRLGIYKCREDWLEPVEFILNREDFEKFRKFAYSLFVGMTEVEGRRFYDTPVFIEYQKGETIGTDGKSLSYIKGEYKNHDSSLVRTKIFII